MVEFFFMSAGSSQRKVHQRTKGGIAASKARIANMPVIPEKNVVRADVLVAPLDVISDIIQSKHWSYLYNCACIVLTRLVKEFYAHLEVVQDEESGIVLQSTVEWHVLQIDPQVISRILGVPMLHISASPFNEVLEPPTLEDLRKFFHVVPQGEERATNIKIGSFSPPHHLLAPMVRRSDLILKMAQFLYAIIMRLPFFLCKHILNIMLEARDESTTRLPFACLITKIILQSRLDIFGEPKLKIQDPLGNQTLMKSNAQLRHEGQDEPPPVHVELPVGASSSLTAPQPPQFDAGFAHILAALESLQGGMSAMQWVFHSIDLRVE